MAVLFVGYDLNSPGQDYKNSRTELKKTGTYWNNLDSTWLIVSNETVVQLRDRLKKHLDTNDELLVLDVSGDREHGPDLAMPHRIGFLST